MPTIERLLRIPEAAKLTGISDRTLRKMITDGQTPDVVRIGERTVRFRASDIHLWLELGCPGRDLFEAEKANRQAHVVGGTGEGQHHA